MAKRNKIQFTFAIILLLLIPGSGTYGNGSKYSDSLEVALKLHHETASYELASKIGMELLGIYEAAKNKENECKTLITIGEIYRGSKHFDFAITNVKLGLQKAIRIEDSVLIGRAYNRLAAIYFELGNQELTMIYVDSSDSFALRSNNISQQISNINIRGAVMRIQRRYKEAIDWNKMALALSVKEGEKDNEINSHFNIGHVYLNLNQFDKALEHAEVGISLANESGITSQMTNGYNILANAHEGLGNFKEAFHYLRLFYDLNESYLNFNSKKRIELLNASLETERKIRENAELKQKLATTQNRYILGGLILLILLSLNLTYLWRKQRQTYRLLEASDIEISNQNKELKDLIQSQDKLFSILSHDLISPINYLSETLSLVTSDDVKIEDAKPILKKLHIQTFHIRELTENVLTWARTQMGGAYVNLEVSNICLPVLSSISHVSAIAENKNIAILHDNPDTEILAKIDVEVVRFVTRNILMNAIKFTNPGKKITVSCEEDDTYVIIRIADEGIGIPRHKYANLFVFTAERSYGTGKEKGTGLGLPMCHDMITKAEGKIDFSSIEEVGTTISCYYPKA